MGKPKTKKRIEASGHLDLVPIMNLVTILIPFLLMASAFVSLAVIDSTLPAIGAPPTEPPDEDEKPLNLSVIVTDEGYTVAGSSSKLAPPEEGEGGPTIPCSTPGCPTPDSYDVKKLTELLNEVKDEYPEEENVILVPESTVQYEVLVVTMDATRNDPETKVNGKARMLFPYVVIAGGAQ